MDNLLSPVSSVNGSEASRSSDNEQQSSDILGEGDDGHCPYVPQLESVTQIPHSSMASPFYNLDMEDPLALTYSSGKYFRLFLLLVQELWS